MGFQKAKEEIIWSNRSYRLSKATDLSAAVLRSLFLQAKQRALFSTWIDEEVTVIAFHDNLIAVILRIYF